MESGSSNSISPERAVLHVDMNAFYCACHAAAEPATYANRPTAVAGSPETRHGVVVTASYEARAKGVRATMTVAEALRACPDVLLIHPDFDLYRKFSRAVFDLVRNYTPQIQIFSIDECFADVTGSHQFGTPLHIAKELQQRILNKLGLPCSIGVASNKFLAKMASDLHKPMGLTELYTTDIPTSLWPLPLEAMFGVGEKTAERLRRLGLHSIGDIAAASPERLFRSLGKRGLELRELANGRDASPVNPIPEPLKSVGHSITLSSDSGNLDELSTIVMNLSDQVGRRVRRHGLAGRTIQLTIRYANRQTFTRSKTMDTPTDLTETIYEEAKGLLIKHKRPAEKVRLLGVTLQGLGKPGAITEPNVQLELPLFESGPGSASSVASIVASASGGRVQRDAKQGAPRTPIARDDARRRALTEVTDRLRDRYGEDILVRGRMLQPHESAQVRDRKVRGTSLQKDTLT